MARTQLHSQAEQNARRQRINNMLKEGKSSKEIAAAEGITLGTVYYYAMTTGRPQKKPGRKPKRRYTRAVNGRERIQPIVLGAETVADTDERRYKKVIDALWSHLPLETKVRAIESLSEVL